MADRSRTTFRGNYSVQDLHNHLYTPAVDTNKKFIIIHVKHTEDERQSNSEDVTSDLFVDLSDDAGICTETYL